MNTSLTSSPQDKLLLRIVSLWAVLLVCVSWLLPGLLVLLQYDDTGGYDYDGGHQQLPPQQQAKEMASIIIGCLVNINLVFFYGAPLQTMRIVIKTKSSDSIHKPTLSMNIINAIFWMLYGVAKNDIIIFGPNGIGFLLGSIQGVLCCIFPDRNTQSLGGAG